jgi:peptide/nickel transport system permease protein
MWWKELRKNVMAQLALLFILALIGLAISAPLFPFLDPESPNYRVRNKPPIFLAGGSWQYPLGTDYHGRNILARIVYGARISLFIALVAVSLATGIGVLIGLLAGYYGGRIDDFIMRGVDALISIPSILLTLAMMTLLQPGALNLAIIIGLTQWVWQARTVRSKILSLREEPYIMAARISGASDLWIIWKHILPNIRATITVIATTQIGWMIIIESSLSFFGMSGSTLSWGWDIATGRNYLSTGWWITSMPGFAILATVMSFNIVGDWMRDFMDPFLRT